jgi:5-formyltetrahydrofolate cyclo-ligase
MESAEGKKQKKGLTDGKEQLRREMQQTRRSREPAWIVAASQRIQKAVLGLPQFQQAARIGCYLALPYEVQSRAIIEAAWAAGKRVCVPAFNEEKDRYELTWLDPDEDTQPGRWNIREPRSARRAGSAEVDFIVVPALAYDRMGHRLGHGGGHYDRILGSWAGFRVGVAFEFQVFDQVPMGSQDVPVDLVVTEKAVYPLTVKSDEK